MQNQTFAAALDRHLSLLKARVTCDAYPLLLMSKQVQAVLIDPG